MKYKYEKLSNYTTINKFSKTIKQIWLTDRQRVLLDNLVNEIAEIHFKLKQETTLSKEIFLLPQIMIEGESSSLIEGTITLFEDFPYDIEEMNNIPQWETRNLINLYQKYLGNEYYFNNFLLNANSVAQLHLELYENNPQSKFKMVFNTTKEIQRVKPGKILDNDELPNTIGGKLGIDNAMLVPIKPSLKHEYLEDLMQTVKTKLANHELLYEHIIISHPIFEAIHPFNDGNGRIGRLLLNILLQKIRPELVFPLYLSEAFNEDKETYKKNLLSVQLGNNNYESWNEWISYFIDCMIKTKRIMKYRATKIIELWNKTYNHPKLSTQSRKYIHSLFYKYYKLNKKLTIHKAQQKFPKLSIQSIYKDWNIVTEIIGAKDLLQDDYFAFEDLRKIMRYKVKSKK